MSENLLYSTLDHYLIVLQLGLFGKQRCVCQSSSLYPPSPQANTQLARQAKTSLEQMVSRPVPNFPLSGSYLKQSFVQHLFIEDNITSAAQ